MNGTLISYTPFLTWQCHESRGKGSLLYSNDACRRHPSFTFFKHRQFISSTNSINPIMQYCINLPVSKTKSYNTSPTGSKYIASTEAGVIIPNRQSRAQDRTNNHQHIHIPPFSSINLFSPPAKSNALTTQSLSLITTPSHGRRQSASSPLTISSAHSSS